MNNNEPRLLTVKEFAKEKNISITTVYVWMRRGLFDELLKNPGEVFLIPESYLSVHKPSRPKKEKSPRVNIPRHKRLPPSNLDESRERFNKRSGGKKIVLSFDELKDLFDEGLSLREIGARAGVSWQAISQIYSKYFAPFSFSNRERRNRFVRERQIKRAEEQFLSVEKLAKLTEIVTNLGMDIEPHVSKRNLTRCNTYRVTVNDRLCGVYHLISTHNSASYRSYYRINLSRTAASKVEFVIFFTGEELGRAFVIPSEVIKERYDPESEKYWKTFYIPTEKYPVYNNQYPKIDWWEWENRWDQLKGENNEQGKSPHMDI